MIESSAMSRHRDPRRARVIRSALLLGLAAAGIYFGYIALLFYLGRAGAAG
jgi:hypothetical protein